MSPFIRPVFRALLLGAATLVPLACAGTEEGLGGGDTDPEFGADAPAWVRTGRVPGLLDAMHITGLGYSASDLPEADAYDQAKLAAFTDISTQIETFVSNEFTSIQRSVFHNEDIDETADYRSVSRQVTREVLAGVEVVRRYYAPETGTACVVAAMDREKYGRRLLKQAEDARTAADGYLEAFARSQAEGGASESARSLVLARGAMDTVIGAHLKAIAVKAPPSIQGRIAALNDPERTARITQELARFKNRVRIAPVSGNEQKALLTGLLREPVVVEVRLEEDGESVPLPAFPMRVIVEDESKATAIPHGETTDSEGRFSFDLRELKSTGSAANTVLVQLDFQAIHKNCSIEGPALGITYFMPTRDNTRIGVIIHETVDGTENRNAYTGSALKEALTDLGFQVIRVEPGKDVEDVVALPQADLVSRFGPSCDYLIVGTAVAERSSSDGNIEWYFTRLTIDAIELETAKTIHLEVPMGQSTKQGDRNRNKAWRKSLEAAAAVLVGDPKKGDLGLLGRKFVARFEEGADWSE
jgi:hypothetical protein